jgi:excisionase family DNA binding protein
MGASEAPHPGRPLAAGRLAGMATMKPNASGFGPRPTAGPLLSVVQVAKLLGICTKTVYRHIGDGRLKAVRAGRLWRVSPEAVGEFLQHPDELKSTLVQKYS